MGSLLKTGSITYKEDILKKMSEELSIPVKELEEIVDLNILYIKDTIENSDNLLISLPSLCKIRLNNRMAFSYINNNIDSKFLKRRKKVEQLQKKLDSFTLYKENNNDWNSLLNIKKPLFERLWKKYTKSKYVNRVTRKVYKMIEELEQETNRIIEKIS